MNRKEEWIDKVMYSLKDMDQLKAPAHLRHKILSAVTKPTRQAIPARLSWGLAAGLALLITINALSVVHLNRQQHMNGLKNVSQAIVQEYYNSVTN